MSFLKNEYGIISGFSGVCTVLKQCIVCFDPQCLMKRWANMKGKPEGAVHQCTEGWTLAKPVAHLLHVSNQSPTFTSHHKDPALERNTLDLMDGLFVLFCLQCLKACWVSSKICHERTVCFLMEGSRQFHYVACAWTWWHVKKNQKKKKNQKGFKKKVFFLLLFSFSLRRVRFSDHVHVVCFCIPIRVMSLKLCSDRWQMYITPTIVVKLQWGGRSFCSSKATFFFSPKNDSFCTHLLNSSHVVAVRLFWLFILFLLSREEAFWGVYTSVCGRFSVWKKMCETF